MTEERSSSPGRKSCSFFRICLYFSVPICVYFSEYFHALVVDLPVQHGAVRRADLKFIFHAAVNDLSFVKELSVVAVLFNADMGIVCAGYFGEGDFFCLFQRDPFASRRFFTGKFGFGIKA